MSFGCDSSLSFKGSLEIKGVLHFKGLFADARSPSFKGSLVVKEVLHLKGVFGDERGFSFAMFCTVGEQLVSLGDLVEHHSRDLDMSNFIQLNNTSIFFPVTSHLF